jgi:hypothetical protein
MTDTFRELCAEVLAFHHGEGRYNFSGLNPYDRDNAAFDAWQDIRQRLKSALAQPAPAPAVVPVAVAERPWEREGWCDQEGRCWFLSSRFSTWSLDSPPVALARGIGRCLSLPAHAIPLPQAGEVEA